MGKNFWQGETKNNNNNSQSRNQKTDMRSKPGRQARNRETGESIMSSKQEEMIKNNGKDRRLGDNFSKA